MNFIENGFFTLEECFLYCSLQFWFS
jgi:hypothetical protein